MLRLILPRRSRVGLPKASQRLIANGKNLQSIRLCKFFTKKCRVFLLKCKIFFTFAV